MYKTDVNEEMIHLMRGFFAMPVISNFGRLGVLEKFIKNNEVSHEEFENIPNTQVLKKSFDYLARLSLLIRLENGHFQATPLGREIFKRHSSFYVPHSYHEYMNSFDKLLTDESIQLGEEVDRLENVIGSGKTHQRYFLPAISFLKRKVQFDCLCDVGCGNGYFLREGMRSLNDISIAGVDLSPISVKTTSNNLKVEFADRKIKLVCSDAFDIDYWANQLKSFIADQKVALSMWFLIHEISQNDPEIVIKYLNEIHAHFPKAPLVLGELVRHDETVLSNHRNLTIMPEYLFFHDLSGQGILSWDCYQDLLSKIPYSVAVERTFDELQDENGRHIPSAFVWCLIPKENQ